MAWKCGICLVFLAITLKAMLTHIRESHSHKPNFNVFCGVDGCQKRYTKINSFYKHVTRHHTEEFTQHACQNNDPLEVALPCTATDIPADEFTFTLSGTAAISDVDLLDVPDDVDDVPVAIGHVRDPMQEREEKKREMEIEAAKFILGMKEKHRLTQAAIQDLIHHSTDMIQKSALLVRDDIVNVLDDKQQQGQPQTVDRNTVDGAFEDLFNPFNKISTAYYQKKYLANVLGKLPLHIVKLGEGIQQTNIANQERIILVPHRLYLLSLKSSIEQLLQNELIFQLVTSAARESFPNFITDIYDGEAFKAHELFSKRLPNCLYIQIYYDDLEYTTGKGSKSKKLAMFYFRLGNLPIVYRSRLESIRLLGCVDWQLLKTYGINRILEPMLRELDDLQKNGWILQINGREVHFTGTLHLIIGDTPASNLLTGFKVSPGGAFDKCRMCQCPDRFMQNQFLEDQFEAMSLEKYLENCEDIQAAQSPRLKKHFQRVYGINEQSILATINGFDLTQFAPYDLMHVFNEGILPYEIKHILIQWIQVENLFSLEQFNDEFLNYFSLFRKDSFQTPTPITRTILNSQQNTLKQTASTMASLLIGLPFILNNLVDSDDHFFKFLLQLIQIYNIVMASCFSGTTLQKLGNLIQKHLNKFKELFPHLRIIPKQHYMIHLPKIIAQHGPPRHYNTTRFEGKHKEHRQKLIAKQNYKNVSHSVSECASREEALHNLVDEAKFHPLFANDSEAGKMKLYHNLDYLKNKLEQFQNIHRDDVGYAFVTKKLDLPGLTVLKDYTFVAAEVRENQVQFGLVQEIFLVNGNHKQVFLELKMYHTLGFEENLNSFEIVPLAAHIAEPDMPEAHILVKPADLIDVNSYFGLEVNDSLYIPCYYNLIDVVQASKEGVSTNNLADRV